MTKFQFQEQGFAFYELGTHIADVIFSENGVSHRKKNIETNEWLPFIRLEKEDISYRLPLLKIWSNLKELQHIDWNEHDNIKLGNGCHYQRYMKFEGNVDGIKSEAWLWALRNEKFPVDLFIADGDIVGFVLTKRDGCYILVKPGFEDITILKHWKDPLLSENSHGIRHIGMQHVTMGDGVKLATDVWLPADLKEGLKVPAILVRTPYGRFIMGEVELRFVRRGYALVAQDTRGREDSEGEWVPFIHEKEDGNDTLNWIAEQPWSDGNVGMIGGSYGGYVQWAAAASGNIHLKAVVSLVTAGSPFVDLPRKGGAVMSGTLAWAFMMSRQRTDFNALSRDDWEEILSIRPIKDIPAKALGRDIHFWDEWMKHPDDDRFWQKADWSLHGENIGAASLIISGWYDDDGAGTTQAWEMVEEHGLKNQRLILGPWYHQANSTRQIHDIQFGNNTIRYDIDLLYLRWFDRFLKNIDNGVEKEPRVQYYMVGDNEWKESAKWPPKEAEYTNLYMHSSGNAKTSLGDGYLNFEAQGNEEGDSYTFDPSSPAPYLIDVSENECSVPENYKEVEMREDVLVYTSESLKEDIAIAGDIYATLYASSSARDTDWIVRLTDVDEEGNSIRLSDGIIRARYRNSFEKPELLKPGEIEKYEIKMSKIANVFKKNHRIRVSVTSGAKNLVFPNHNTGNDPAADIEMVKAVQRVYHDEKNPSHVKLPLI
ncbi:MAG: CocE/NonD family hydrolase [Clostridiaceae bacterium]|nr:CocE/NonD family hydrolase [Clostridiaceae bacterium]